jgi:hypothetical protein
MWEIGCNDYTQDERQVVMLKEHLEMVPRTVDSFSHNMVSALSSNSSGGCYKQS